MTPKPLTGELIDLFNPDLYADIPSEEERTPTFKHRRTDYTVTPATRKHLSETQKAFIRQRRNAK